MLWPSDARPADAGAKIRNSGLLRLLRECHKVDVLAFGDADADAADDVELVARPRARGLQRRALEAASTAWPDMALRLWSTRFEEKVRGRLRETRYEAVQAEGIEMARYLRAVAPERRVYDAHNAEFLLQQRLAATGSGP